VIGLFIFAAILLYSMRTNISIALGGAKGMGAQFGWGNRQKGVILSAFLFGYFVMNIFGGYLATRFGGHPVALCGMLASKCAYFLPSHFLPFLRCFCS
jgi:MFS family permease